MKVLPDWRFKLLAVAAYPLTCTPACAEAGRIPTMVRVDPSANVQLSEPKWLFPDVGRVLVNKDYVLACEISLRSDYSLP